VQETEQVSTPRCLGPGRVVGTSPRLRYLAAPASATTVLETDRRALVARYGIRLVTKATFPGDCFVCYFAENRQVAKRTRFSPKHAPMIVPLIVVRRFVNSLHWLHKARGMSDDNEGVRLSAEEPRTSERWGNPPPWSPWNFQSTKRSRGWQSHVYRAAQASAHSRDE
jgi:hypothetical protein